MTRSRWIAVLLAVALATTAIGLTSAAATNGGLLRPDLKGAVQVSGRCRDYADALPSLTVADGVRPGEAVGSVTVCLTNHGLLPGRLRLSIVERVDTDAACTGDEAAVDPTCGANRTGELSSALLLVLSVDPTCKRTTPKGAQPARPLRTLEATPADLQALMLPLLPVCVRLDLQVSSDPALAAISQSDTVTWRYSFTLAAVAM